MRIRWRPGKENFPAFHGRYVVDTSRGQLRVRKWPRKRGRPKSAAVRLQNAWFKDANRLAKHCAASQQVAAIEMTKGTGLYPRDLLLKCMSGGIIAPITAEGRELEYKRIRVDPVSWQGFALNLQANWTIGVGVLGAPDWPLPTRDDLGFWSPANPSYITVPPGVNWMQFYAGGMCTVVFNGNLVVLIRDNAVVDHCRAEAGGNTSHGATVSTGPVPVVAGQIFQANWFFTGGGTLEGTNRNTFFAGVVLEGG